MTTRRVGLLSLLTLFVVTLVLWGAPAWKTVVFLHSTLPHTPAWAPVADTPVTRESPHFPRHDGEQIVDLYHPVGKKDLAAGLVLVPGLNPEAHRDERLVRVAESMARVGVMVAVPHSDHIAAQRFHPDDISRIADTFHFLARHNAVDENRIGLSGFSVAGSYAIRAATTLGDQPAVVHAFGPYYDVSTLLVDILSHTTVENEDVRSWEPDPYVTAIAENLLAADDAPDDLSDDSYTKEQPAMSRDEARAIVTALSEDQLATLHDISLAPVVDQLRTPLILMHDQHDRLIPVEASRHIRAGLPSDATLSYGEYTFLHHVTPERIFTLELFPFTLQIFHLMNRLF